MPIEFHVVDVESPFNAILGRPWITTLNAVPSVAHQCLKFPYEGKVVKLHNVNLPEPDHEENKIMAAPANEKPLLSITDLSIPKKSQAASPYKKPTPADGWKIMAHLGDQPGHGLGANLQGPLHPIREPYQFGKEGLRYEGESGNRTPLTWTLKAHFVQDC